MTRPKIAICGWIGSSNLGDELIADQVAGLIREAGGEPTLVTIADDAAIDTATISPFAADGGEKPAQLMAERQKLVRIPTVTTVK